MGGPRRHAARTLALGVAAALVVTLVAGPTAGAGPDGGPAGSDLPVVAPDGASIGVRTGWLSWLWCLLGLCGGIPEPTTSTTASTTSSSSSTSSSSTTTPDPDPDPGCEPLPRDGGGTWECAFSDEFDGDALDRTAWTPQLTAVGSFENGRECFIDDPDNIAVQDGALVLTVRRERSYLRCPGIGRTRYTSGMVSLRPTPEGAGFAQAYGRYEVRARVTGAPVRGLQESIWMYPVTPRWVWPLSGEIDIAEIFHRYPDRAIPFVHHGNVLDPNRTNNHCLVDDISAFHDYVLEWTPESIRILYDGELCLEDRWVPLPPLTGRQPFDEPFYLVLTQALGVGENAFDVNVTPLPASTVVDHVRIWQ